MIEEFLEADGGVALRPQLISHDLVEWWCTIEGSNDLILLLFFCERCYRREGYQFLRYWAQFWAKCDVLEMDRLCLNKAETNIVTEWFIYRITDTRE